MNKSAKLSFYIFAVFLTILIPIKAVCFVNGYDFNSNLYVINNFVYILFKVVLILSMIIIALPVFFDKSIKIQYIDSTKISFGILNLIYGLSFIYDAFLDLINITSKVNNSLLDFIIVIFGIISGIFIIIYGFLIVFKKASDSSIILLIVPLIYYITIVLKQFLYTQIKTYFDDGIFLILRDLCVLLFLISLIKNVFGNGTVKNFKIIIIFGLTSVLLNIITIFNGDFFSGKYYDAFEYVGISNIVFSAYIIVYLKNYIFNFKNYSESKNDMKLFINNLYNKNNENNETDNIEKLNKLNYELDDVEISNINILDNEKKDDLKIQTKLENEDKETIKFSNIDIQETKLFEVKSSDDFEQNLKIDKDIDVDDLNKRIDSLLEYFD